MLFIQSFLINLRFGRYFGPILIYIPKQFIEFQNHAIYFCTPVHYLGGVL